MATSFCRRTRLSSGYTMTRADQERECPRCIRYAFRREIKWGAIEVLKDTRDGTFHYRRKAA